MRLVPVDEHSTAKFGRTHRVATIDERHHFYICSDSEAKELGHESNIRGERNTATTEIMGGSITFYDDPSGLYAVITTAKGYLCTLRW